MNKKIKVLLADDEDTFRRIMANELSRMGYDVAQVENGEDAVSKLNEKDFDIVLLDINMPVMSGVEALNKIKEISPSTEVLMLTGEASVESAVKSMKLGAYDYLTKPCKLYELDMLLNKAYEKRMLTKENKNLKFMVNKLVPPTLFYGESKEMNYVFKLIDKVAKRDCTVLIQGESGVGKELIAKSIHEKSERAERPFVVINCAALHETLLDSELFGHSKGAFTGANQARTGLFEVADESTIFLDEIGEMPLNIQAKLLRVLQSGEIRRVGENKSINVNVRVIAATNKDLARETSLGNFREDLYFRLNVVEIHMPPLRDRKDDIPPLVEHFLAKSSLKGVAKSIDATALQTLVQFDWPGNVRQLENTIERLVILSEEDIINNGDIPFNILSPNACVSGNDLQLNTTLPEIERNHIKSMLREKEGNKKDAAKSLGISLKTLYNKLKLYNIEV